MSEQTWGCDMAPCRCGGDPDCLWYFTMKVPTQDATPPDRTPYRVAGAGSDLLPCPKFGDVVENGWASEGNPQRRGYFVRAFTRKGRMNPGLTWELTDKAGSFWEVQPRVIGERLSVSPSSPETGERVDLVERLREMVRTDHLRGCEGREYECSCGHTDRQDALLLEAATALSAPSPSADALRDQIERLTDKVEGLDADLYCAVEVAYKRGATEWTRLNYPEWFERFTSPPAGGRE